MVHSQSPLGEHKNYHHVVTNILASRQFFVFLGEGKEVEECAGRLKIMIIMNEWITKFIAIKCLKVTKSLVIKCDSMIQIPIINLICIPIIQWCPETEIKRARLCYIGQLSIFPIISWYKIQIFLDLIPFSFNLSHEHTIFIILFIIFIHNMNWIIIQTFDFHGQIYSGAR